jgi:hypothetical protein
MIPARRPARIPTVIDVAATLDNVDRRKRAQNGKEMKAQVHEKREGAH